VLLRHVLARSCGSSEFLQKVWPEASYVSLIYANGALRVAAELEGAMLMVGE
jgi:hypothetical protein